MKKSKLNNMMIIDPNPCELQDIVRTLQEQEVSILVNMTGCEFEPGAMDLVMDYILSGARSYMSISVKKIFPKVFVCFSKRQKI